MIGKLLKTKRNKIVIIVILLFLFIIAIITPIIFSVKDMLISPLKLIINTGMGTSISYNNVALKDVEIPKDFPKDLPIYPNTTGFIQFLTAFDNPGVSVRSKDSISEIAKWFEGNLKKSGWTITQNSYDVKWMTYDIFMENSKYTGHITITNRDSGNEGKTTKEVRIHEYIKKK